MKYKRVFSNVLPWSSVHSCPIGSLASVKAILEIAGKDSLEHRDSQNRTPLHVATMGGHGEVVNFLLSQEG